MRSDRQGQIDIQSRSDSDTALYLQIPMVVSHHLTTNRQADTGAGIFVRVMQALEQLKYFIFVSSIETDSIIRKFDSAEFSLGILFRSAGHIRPFHDKCTNFNYWPGILPDKFKAVVQQLLQQHTELFLVPQ